MKNRFTYCICAAMIAGCAVSAPRFTALHIDFSEISQHAGERVHVCGWLQANIEECSLSPKSDVVDPSKQVWIITRDKVCQPQHAVSKPTAAWVELEGTIASGGSYGHLGLYPSSIAADVVAFRNSPCK